MSTGSENRPDRDPPPSPAGGGARDGARDGGGDLALPTEGAEDVARWRRDERRRLVAGRLAVPVRERRRVAGAVIGWLERWPHVGDDAVVSVYWPCRGELDLRPWMHALHASGVRVALPRVEAAGQPLSFLEWTPRGRMAPGVWRIPVPVDGEVLSPSIIVAPLVGYDAEGYRLGNGGGFFDRTLAHLKAAGERPRVVGVGHSAARMPTIRPQPHDVPMDVIVTETERFARAGREALAR